MKTTSYGTLMVVVSAVGFGLMGIFAKIAYGEGMTVGTLLACRFLIAAALFWGTLAIVRPRFTLTRRETITLHLMGVGGYAVMATLLFTAFYLIPASLAEMLFYAYPALVCLLMRWLDKEPVTVRKAASLGIGMLGTALVLGVPAGMAGVALVLCSLLAAELKSGASSRKRETRVRAEFSRSS
ncbi:DMT family transporter [Paenibacillus hamazuiensis]|uniref:DMT family transporter n=1 Tax=Paenibacillus hamazuiensis TaxID=2936508 RepID=UPI00200DD2B6|nr:DMT family transporter [Paenibacillus hamazuiensis]